MKRQSFVALTLWCISVDIQAAPVVLFDGGATRALPAAPAPTRALSGDRAQLSSPHKNAILPIRTPELSVGRITRRATPASPYMVRPTCVIGSDPASISWLHQYKSQLVTRNAYCWLVQAETVDDLNRVANAAEGLIVIPAPGSILQQAFGIQHYPVLISPKWIEQ